MHLEFPLMAIIAITELDQFLSSPSLSRPAETIKECLARSSSCSTTTPHHAQALLFGQTQFARVRRPPRFPTTVTRCMREPGHVPYLFHLLSTTLIRFDNKIIQSCSCSRWDNVRSRFVLDASDSCTCTTLSITCAIAAHRKIFASWLFALCRRLGV
jgi:hypothetical protein